MRFVSFAFVLCVVGFSLQSCSCGFILDALHAAKLNIQQGFHTTIGVAKDLPKRFPTPNEVYEFGKNVVIGLPLELTFDVIHQFCEYFRDNFKSPPYNKSGFVSLFRTESYGCRCNGTEFTLHIGAKGIHTRNREFIICSTYKSSKRIHSNYRANTIVAAQTI